LLMTPVGMPFSNRSILVVVMEEGEASSKSRER
jgi:hypothetical protein